MTVSTRVEMTVITQPTLSANVAFPALAGTPITWTAQATGGAAGVLFKFLRHDAASGWQLVQDYSPSNVYTWTPGLNDTGPHFVQVWVKTPQSTEIYDAYAGTSAFSIVKPIPVVTSFTHNGAFPMTPNTPVQLSAVASGGSGPLQYRFIAFREGAGWSVLQEYSSATTISWTPALAGTYSLQVWVRSEGVSDVYEAWSGMGPLRVSTTDPLVVGLTRDQASVRAGSPVTFRATATGGTAGPLQYRFVRFHAQRGWVVGQDYSPSRTYAWTPGAADAGDNLVQVWVRNAGSTATYDAWATTGFFTVRVDPISTPMLTANVVFPVPSNSPVTWTVRAAGGIAPLQYQFLVFRQGSGWTIERTYAAQNTFTWTPPADGTYAVQAWVRSAGSAATFDAWVGSGTFTIGSSGPARIAAFGADVPLPASAGTTIRWTALASGGTAGPLQYQFVRLNQQTGAWSVVQAYGPGNTFTWTPAATDRGSHVLQVWVKSAGAPGPYENWATTGSFAIR
jgi:hypothetical protein